MRSALSMGLNNLLRRWGQIRRFCVGCVITLIGFRMFVARPKSKLGGLHVHDLSLYDTQMMSFGVPGLRILISSISLRGNGSAWAFVSPCVALRCLPRHEC